MCARVYSSFEIENTRCAATSVYIYILKKDIYIYMIYTLFLI